jgi:CheY-like chemotaxis protein
MLTYLNWSNGWQGDVAVENGAQSGDAIRLLLVEDTPGDAATLMALLARSTAPSIQVEHVVSLERASDFLDRHEVDLIVLDLGLPDAQGLEGVELLAARHAATPFVVLTGTDDDNLAQSFTPARLAAWATYFCVCSNAPSSALAVDMSAISLK